jgi:hypothetical protein
MTGPLAAQKLEVKAERDPEADFSAIRTYAVRPPPKMIMNVAPGAASNPDLTHEVLGPHIMAALERELASRGLVKAPEDTADVHVIYFSALTTGFSQTYLGEYYGYVTGFSSPIAPGFTPSTSSTVHQKGTIVVDIVQRAAKRGIWRGSVVTRIADERELEKRITRINEAMGRIFQRFPIKPRG